MIKKLFSSVNRPVWVGVGLVAILAIAMAFAPARAIANSFLGLFRVEQVTIVQVDPSNIPKISALHKTWRRSLLRMYR